MKSYGIEYPWRGGKYVLTVHAESEVEAMERVQNAAHFGRCYTPFGIAATVPASAGPLVRLWTWLANMVRS